MKAIAYATVLVLAGCVTMGADPISVGPDTYQMSMTGVGFATQANTNMKALKVASAFCARTGLRMMPRHTEESGVYGFSPRQNTLVFLCVKDSDPRYQSGTWRKDNGVTTIENR